MARATKESVREYLKREELCGLTSRTRCISCGDTVAQILRGRDGKYALLDSKLLFAGGDDYDEPLGKEGFICWPCYENDLYGHPVVSGRLHLGDGSVPFKAGRYVLSTRDEDYEDNPFMVYDKACDLIKQYCQKVKWHKTDPWRGYFSSDFDGSWEKVIDDWFGSMDGYNIGDNDLGRFHRLYESDKIVPDVPILVNFPTTSNICACGIEVYVRKEDIPAFKEWLGVEKLEVSKA